MVAKADVRLILQQVIRQMESYDTPYRKNPEFIPTIFIENKQWDIIVEVLKEVLDRGGEE